MTTTLTKIEVCQTDFHFFISFQKRRKSLATNDSDDEDDHNREVLMLKKHAEERLAVLHSEKLQVGDEVEDVCINLLPADHNYSRF